MNTMEKTIISDFRQQEYLFLQKVSPKLRDVIKNHIIKYDLSHSTLKIIKNNDNFDIIMKKLKEALMNREIYLTELISKCV
jgi:hypothetical protein